VCHISSPSSGLQHQHPSTSVCHISNPSPSLPHQHPSAPVCHISIPPPRPGTSASLAPVCHISIQNPWFATSAFPVQVVPLSSPAPTQPQHQHPSDTVCHISTPQPRFTISAFPALVCHISIPLPSTYTSPQPRCATSASPTASRSPHSPHQQPTQASREALDVVYSHRCSVQPQMQCTALVLHPLPSILYTGRLTDQPLALMWVTRPLSHAEWSLSPKAMICNCLRTSPSIPVQCHSCILDLMILPGECA
jgi:hypothetical protein